MKTGTKNLIRFFLAGLVAVLLIQFLFLDLVKVAGDRMAPALQSNEVVLVKKWVLGPRIPFTPLTIPFFPGWYAPFWQWPYLRLPGISQVHYNDLLVFNNPAEVDNPIDKKMLFIKRVKGLPGDTLQLVRGKCIVNQTFSVEPLSVVFWHRVVTLNHPFPAALARKYQLESLRPTGVDRVFDMLVNPLTADSLSREQGVVNVRRLKQTEKNQYKVIFPKDDRIPWDKDDFGPVLIPARGLTISLDPSTLPVYREAIEDEGNQIGVMKDRVIINEKEVESYTFRYNYYFVMDDQRDGANDSRYWGFLPENHVVGLAGPVVFRPGRGH